MRTAWGILVVCMLVPGCSSKKKERDNSPIVREEEVTAPLQPPPTDDDEALLQAAEPVNPDTIVKPAPTDPKPECVDDSPVVSWDPNKLKACFDSNGDDQADRCVTWRRDGKVATIDTVFAVEDADAKEEPEPAIEYRSDTENNDDERIMLDGTHVDVCPYDRTCLRIMPKLGEGELSSVLTDPEYKRAVFVIRGYDGDKGTFEIWDLTAGRMRTRAAMKRLVADETYDFTAHLGSGAIIGIADDSNGRALGTIFGTDGSFRGELAQGSRNLDVDKSFTHAGVFGITDVGSLDADEKPYVVYFHSLSTGAALGKLSIKRDDSGHELVFDKLKNGFVGIRQFGEQVRIDMFDLRSRTNRVLFAPGC